MDGIWDVGRAYTSLLRDRGYTVTEIDFNSASIGMQPERISRHPARYLWLPKNKNRNILTQQ